MVRTYKKKGNRNTEINEDVMSKALKDVLNVKLSLRRAALAYNIKLSTLKSRVQKTRTKIAHFGKNNRTFNSKYTSSQIFSLEEENDLNSYIEECSEIYNGLTISQVRKFAYEYAKAIGIEYPISWDENKMTGVDWINGFRKRNPNIYLKMSAKTTPDGPHVSNKSAFTNFFNNLEEIYLRYHFTSNRIVNLVSCYISTSLKVFAPKTQKQVDNLKVAKEQLVTFGGIVSASGNTIPPVFIFPRDSYDESLLAGAPEGSFGTNATSGRINSQIFVNVLKHIKKHLNCSRDKPILLLLDSKEHQCHVGIESINFAQENGIICLELPPHIANRLQPLDGGVLGLFNTKLQNVYNKWFYSNAGQTIAISDIPKFTKRAYLDSFTGENITKRFKIDGIWPFNRQACDEDDFILAFAQNIEPRYNTISAKGKQDKYIQNSKHKILDNDELPSTTKGVIPGENNSTPTTLKNKGIGNDEFRNNQKIRSDYVKIRTNNKNVANTIPNDYDTEPISHMEIVPKFEIFEVEEELMDSEQINTQMQSSFINMPSTNQHNIVPKLEVFDDDEVDSIETHTTNIKKNVLPQQTASPIPRPIIEQTKKVVDIPTREEFDLLRQKMENQSMLYDVLTNLSSTLERQTVATERQAAATEALLQYLKAKDTN